MASLQLNHIYKVYENGTKAVSDFNMEIEDKEFIVFVGPSGCGKSTTLRMIAGLEEITAGDLFIGDRLVNELEPKDRDVTMVFQNYALYPHMTVYENMAFGLRIAKVPKSEIDKRVHEAAKILDIEEYLDKKPKEMSGGQRQRVALGRAIVRHPQVFLLDEPLSNLDAKLRATMRTEISKLHKRLATTFIYVTHDQVEAMTMGTRIVVMKKGFIQQIDTPKNLYQYPENRFVAGFIGTPQMNFYPSKLQLNGNEVTLTFKNQTITFKSQVVEKMDKDYLDGREIMMGIRPEDIHYLEKMTKDQKKLAIKVHTQVVEELGAETLVNATIDGSEDSIVFKVRNTVEVEPNQEMLVMLDPTKLHFFDMETEKTLLPRIPLKRHFELVYQENGCKLWNQTIQLPPLFKEVLKEDRTYTLVIPTAAIKEGNDFMGHIEQVEKVGKQFLLHISVDKNVIFAVTEKNYKVGEDYGFAIDYRYVSVEENHQEVMASIQEDNHIMGRLHRIKKEVKVLRHGKEKMKKKTGFDFDIAHALIDVPVEMYDRILAVLVKKFELHVIDYSITSEAGKFSLEPAKNGIPLKFVRRLDYGKEQQYGVFHIQDEEGEKEIVLHLPQDFEEDKTYYLILTYNDVKARDTHFDINLK